MQTYILFAIVLHFMCVYVHVAHLQVHMCAWSPEDNLSCLP